MVSFIHSRTTTVHFSPVQDGIYPLRKVHNILYMCSTMSLRNFPNVDKVLKQMSIQAHQLQPGTLLLPWLKWQKDANFPRPCTRFCTKHKPSEWFKQYNYKCFFKYYKFFKKYYKYDTDSMTISNLMTTIRATHSWC